MLILAFLTLLLIMNGSAVGEIVENVTGIIGHDVLLSCGCSSDYTVAWQKGLRIVNAYPQDDTTQIDQAYVNRTKLFLKEEKSNCSIMIRQISLEDAGVYTCHAIRMFGGNLGNVKSLEVNLTVSENKDNNPPQSMTSESVNAVSISVPILVVLILGLAVLLTLLMKKRHRKNKDDSPAQQPMIGEV